MITRYYISIGYTPWGADTYIDEDDPDGWDRSNYEYSWEQEEITIQEFFIRVAESTCIYPEGFGIIREKYLSKIY